MPDEGQREWDIRGASDCTKGEESDERGAVAIERFLSKVGKRRADCRELRDRAHRYATINQAVNDGERFADHAEEASIGGVLDRVDSGDGSDKGKEEAVEDRVEDEGCGKAAGPGQQAVRRIRRAFESQ